MNSSSWECQWRNAETAPGLMVVRLTPKFFNPSASPSRRFARPATADLYCAGYAEPSAALTPAGSRAGSLRIAMACSRVNDVEFYPTRHVQTSLEGNTMLVEFKS